MNENTEMIVSSNGEPTELMKPDDFENGMAFINPDEMPDLESAEVGINIQPEYLEFQKEGESVRAVFNGIGKITTKDKLNPGQYKEIDAVVIQTKTGIKLNAGANLVSQFRNIRPGTAVQITYAGETRTKNGNDVKTYEVRLLNVPRVNVPAAKPEIQKPKYQNQQRATEYYTLAYSEKFKFSQEEANEHLAACGNDFSKAIEALNGDPFATPA